MIRCIATLFLCAACVTCSGQQPFLKHFTVDDGLPSNETYQVLQDARGYLLIATDRGAVRYDGYSFENIPLESNKLNEPVYYAYRSDSGNIYFSGLKGLIYQYRNNRLYEYRHNRKVASLFKHTGILIANTLSEKDGSLWISYNNDFNYNYRIGSCVVMPDGSVKKLEKEDGIYFNLQQGFFFRQLSSAHFGKEYQPLFISWPDGSVTKDSIRLEWPSGYIRRLYHQQVGDYHFFCIGRKLLIYHNNRKVSSTLFRKNILDIFFDNNRVLIGFENGGALEYHFQNGVLGPAVKTWISDFTVNGVYIDHEGGTWFATMESGLFYSHPSGTIIMDHIVRIESIVKKRDDVFVAYGSGRICRFKCGNLVEEYTVPLPGNGYLIDLSLLCRDSMIAIANKGYYLFRQNKWKFFPGSYTAFLETKDHVVCGLGTVPPQVELYDKASGGFTSRCQLPKRILSSFYDKSAQQLWLGCTEGLFKFSNDVLTNMTDSNKLFGERIVGINKVGNWLVVAGIEGLTLYQHDRSVFLNLSGGSSVAPVINSVVVEGNKIWLGTNRGLAVVDCENDIFSIQRYGVCAGLPSLNVHEFAIANGLLYIKWVNKLAIIPLDKLQKQNASMQPFYTAVKLNGKEIDLAQKRELQYRDNTLEFHFNAVNLSGAAEQHFQYKLRGFDNQWHSTGERHVKYTNLPPDNYVFELKVAGSRDQALLASYTFSILPALWQRWWFQVAAGVVFIALVFLVFRRRLRMVQQKNELLLNLAEARERALLQIVNPHFMSNVLNTVQAAILKNEKMNAASVVSQFARLMRMFMEAGRAKLLPLEKEIMLLDKYLQLESVRLPDKFNYRISTGPGVDTRKIRIPSMLIQPLVENAVIHGIMPLNNIEGQIEVNIYFQGANLLCTIADNGAGTGNLENLAAIKKEGHYSSGIKITRNRLELLHREMKTDYFYELKNQHDPTGPEQGTIIIFSLPYTIKDAGHQGNHN